MSRNALLEKIKRAEEVAASEVEKAEKERTTAMNRIPLDQEALLKEKNIQFSDYGTAFESVFDEQFHEHRLAGQANHEVPSFVVSFFKF